LFVAIKGDRFDGHDYASVALERGATGLLVSRAFSSAAGTTVIEVADTLSALQDLAREIRRQSGATVIAITGSAGKTSTKEITADLLAYALSGIQEPRQSEQSHRSAADADRTRQRT
jgi:UDP-N-acetylmuramoyl-tripeptide--D-alanyl-D-alanine ligase